MKYVIGLVIALLFAVAGVSSAQPGQCGEPMIIPYDSQFPWAGHCIEFCEANNGLRTICVGPFPSYCPDLYPQGYLTFDNLYQGYGCESCVSEPIFVTPEYGSGRWDTLDGLIYLCTEWRLAPISYPGGNVCLLPAFPLSNWGSPDCWLPAELMSFNAVSVADGIEITFATASETDLNYFEIVREHNGSAQVVEQIDAENSATGSHYSYLDRDVVFDETYRYYLRTVDLDGSIEEHLDHAITVTYSHPVAIPGAYALRAYPNPFNPGTTISFTLNEAGPAELNVFDATGRIITTLLKEYTASGEHTVAFDAAGLPSGTYFVQLRTATQSRMTRLVLVK